jgi:predicted DNA-binding protein (MmcQ/YjbR family)
MTSTSRIPASLQRAATALRDAALAYPETREDFPWGEQALKVRDKVFLFMSVSPRSLGLSFKLPSSHSVALMLPFASPTGYGLAASGWVSARFGPKDRIPLAMLKMWLEESYIAVAPRKLAAAIATREAESSSAVARKPARAPRPRRKSVRGSGSARR